MEHLRLEGLVIPFLLLLVIGFRPECIMVDVLHTVDLGLASHIVGNVFWELITKRLFGGSTHQLNNASLYEDMNSWYTRSAKARSSKLQGKLTVDRIRTEGGWPKLKAKAANTRHLAVDALDVWKRFSTLVSANDRMILAVCQLLADSTKSSTSKANSCARMRKRSSPSSADSCASCILHWQRIRVGLGKGSGRCNPRCICFALVRVASTPVWKPEILLDPR